MRSRHTKAVWASSIIALYYITEAFHFVISSDIETASAVMYLLYSLKILISRELITLVGASLLLTDLFHLGVATRQFVLEGGVDPFGTEYLGGHVTRGL